MEKNLKHINYILLGLLMLVPGLLKLFVMGAQGVSGMLSGIFLFSWAPIFWAWILIIGEIAFGLAILFRWHAKYASIGAVIILTVATLFVTIKWSAIGSTSWGNLIMHLIAITNYLFLVAKSK